MGVTLTDSEIGLLIMERKILPANYRSLLNLRRKRIHLEGDLEVVRDVLRNSSKHVMEKAGDRET